MFVSLVLLFVTPEFKMEMAKDLTLQGYYEESDALLAKIDGKHNTMRDFYKLINSFQSNRKEEAFKNLKNVEDSFNPLTERRYQAMLQAMKYELEQWKEGELADIARDMKHVADRLNVAKGGKKTQTIQQEIIDKLDRLLEEKEEKAAAAAAAAAAKQQKQSRLPSSGQQIPQDDSIPGSDSGPGNVTEQKLKHYQEIWGKMSEKERARAIQELTRDVPPRYRQVIEDYFKCLNRKN